LSLLLGGPVFVNLTVFGFGLLTVMSLYVYAQKYVRKEFALIPGIIYLTAPVVTYFGTMAYTDNILALYLFLMCMLIVEHENKTSWNVLSVTGLMTGMALGTRYQAIPIIGIIYFALFLTKIKMWRQVLLLLLFTLAIGIVLASPWFIRNMVVTGNPLYPLLQDIFSASAGKFTPRLFVSNESGTIFHRAIKSLTDCYFIPFSYFLSGAMESEDYNRFIGPLFLALAPFVFFIRKNLIKWPFIFIIVLLSFLCVSILIGNLRYFIIMIILLSFLCGGVLQEVLVHARGKALIFLTVVLSLVILGFSFQNYWVMLRHNRILTALNPNLTPYFLRAFERSYRPAEWVNKNLPDDSKVLFHGCLRYFYFKFEPFNDDFGQSVIIYDDAKTAEDILDIMRRHGFTHIICDEAIPDFADKHYILYHKDPRFIDFSRKYLKRIYSINYISIYRIEYSAPQSKEHNNSMLN
jgi:4-amino-4-deoxy-L-arabinose transferase-like glycosyltransferase